MSQPGVSSLSITRPDDWHLHLRDGAALAAVLPHAVRQFARAIIMPNLTPPVTTVAMAAEYRERILAAMPKDGTTGGAKFEPPQFEPLMTLYLTDSTSESEIAAAKQSGFVHGVKYYPAGATTNSEAGVTSPEKAFGAFEALQKHDLPLLVHGEVTTAGVDFFDREKVFLEAVLDDIVRRFPRLRIVVEHATTREAVQYVSQAPANVAASITAHHLLYNRNAIFQGGLRPHFYCLPVLKREEHRQALVAAATSGSPKFFIGTDSAPHAKDRKECDCGSAGSYTAYAALELYAEAFEAAGALDKLEAFTSFNGPDFYRLPRNTGRVTLEKQRWEVPSHYAFGTGSLVPLRAGEALTWKLV